MIGNDGYRVGDDEVGHLIDLHLSEGIVDLGGGELDTEGHEGVPETIVIMMTIMIMIMVTGFINFYEIDCT